MLPSAARVTFICSETNRTITRALSSDQFGGGDIETGEPQDPRLERLSRRAPLVDRGHKGPINLVAQQRSQGRLVALGKSADDDFEGAPRTGEKTRPIKIRIGTADPIQPLGDGVHRCRGERYDRRPLRRLAPGRCRFGYRRRARMNPLRRRSLPVRRPSTLRSRKTRKPAIIAKRMMSKYWKSPIAFRALPMPPRAEDRPRRLIRQIGGRSRRGKRRTHRCRRSPNRASHAARSSALRWSLRRWYEPVRPTSLAAARRPPEGGSWRKRQKATAKPAHRCRRRSGGGSASHHQRPICQGLVIREPARAAKPDAAHRSARRGDQCRHQSAQSRPGSLRGSVDRQRRRPSGERAVISSGACLCSGSDREKYFRGDAAGIDFGRDPTTDLPVCPRHHCRRDPRWRISSADDQPDRLQ